MIKGKVIDQVKDMTGNKFHDRTVAVHIEDAFNTVVGQLFKGDPNQWDLYCQSFTVDVDNVKPRPYALLPKRIIQTPDVANGVRRIFSTDDDNLDYVPMPYNGFQFYGILQLDDVDDSVGYAVRTDRVEFFNLPSIIKQVRMELVLPWSEWDDSQDIPLPSGVANLIIQQAVATLSNQPVETNIYKPKK